MIFQLAWQNIWRVKTRSTILMISIILGVWALIISMGFVNGFGLSFIMNAINLEYSHIQIHHPSFNNDRNISYQVLNSEAIINEIELHDNVKAVTSRTIVDGMVSSAAASRGVTILGVLPEKEEEITRLNESIYKGKYFEGIRRNPIVIGHKLAEKLNVDIKSKIVLTFQSLDTNIIAGAFRVCGILKSNSQKINESNVYVRKSDLNKILGQENIIHEIAVVTTNTDSIGVISQELQMKYSGLEVQSWRELAPELEFMLETTELDKTIILGIILIAFAFGVINTILMSVIERVREFGMLISVGMKRLMVLSMVLTETVFLIITSSVVGVLIGWLTILLLSQNGLDFSMFADGLESMGYSKVIFPIVNVSDYIKIFFGVVTISLIASAYPAIKAVRINPITAMRQKR